MGFSRARRDHEVVESPATVKVAREPEATRPSAHSVASECRTAALDFMAGVARGWDKIDLVLWLTGPYARATRHVSRGGRAPAPSTPPDVDREALEDLLTSTRAKMLAALENAALVGGNLEFVEEAIAEGLVAPVLGDVGIDFWAPVDLMRMRLRDRLRALFAADYLNGPDAYADLHVCHRCEAVVFDARAREFGFCASHIRISGYMRKDPRSAR